MNATTLEEILQNLDLSKEESKVYIELVEGGIGAASSLAKRTGLVRASLYGYIQRLQDVGLVTTTINDEGIKVFQAAAPEIVDRIYQQKIDQLNTQQQAFREILEEMRQFSGGISMPRFQLFEGTEGLRHVLRDMLLYRNITTYSFWPMRTMVEVLGSDFFCYLNKERIRNKLYTQAIWPRDQVLSTKDHPYLGSGEGFLREIRLAPETVKFSMGYWIYANKVAFISSRRESFGFIIESAEMAEMLLAQHQLVWEMSEVVVQVENEGVEFLEEVRDF